MKSEFCNCDNMEFMAKYPDGHFELAIVDPPYGLGETAKKSKGRVTKKYNKKYEEHNGKN